MHLMEHTPLKGPRQNTVLVAVTYHQQCTVLIIQLAQDPAVPSYLGRTGPPHHLSLSVEVSVRASSKPRKQHPFSSIPCTIGSRGLATGPSQSRARS